MSVTQLITETWKVITHDGYTYNIEGFVNDDVSDQDDSVKDMVLLPEGKILVSSEHGYVYLISTQR